MTSGYPLSEKEREFIRQNRHEKYPSVIARALGHYFYDLNGGRRTTETVRRYLKELEEAEAICTSLAAKYHKSFSRSEKETIESL